MFVGKLFVEKLIERLILFNFLLLVSGNAYTQEYTHDSNGNLTKDTNKEISQIHYNHLSLSDTIVYNDGRKTIYIYSASGQKLREQSLAADGTQIQKRDHDDQFFYRNDSLREIKDEDGRAVSLLAGNRLDLY